MTIDRRRVLQASRLDDAGLLAAPVLTRSAALVATGTGGAGSVMPERRAQSVAVVPLLLDANGKRHVIQGQRLDENP